MVVWLVRFLLDTVIDGSGVDIDTMYTMQLFRTQDVGQMLSGIYWFTWKFITFLISILEVLTFRSQSSSTKNLDYK